MIQVEPGTLVVFSDIGCPWSHAAVYRLLAARSRLGLDGEVVLDHRAFPLELINQQPTPRRILDAEIPVVGGMEPDAGWQMWQGAAATWPVTTLPGLEAVQAAKQQSRQASEQLDRALRVAFFGESRCISMRHVILEAAAGCDLVDEDALQEALDDGRARGAVIDDFRIARGEQVAASPHVFLPDGSDSSNPGVRMHWEGQHGVGFPVVDADDPDVYLDLIKRAAG